MSHDLPMLGSFLSAGGQAAAIDEVFRSWGGWGMEARQTQAADWEALRQLRLAALADAPDAFASTLEAELAFPAEVWRQRAEGAPASANFIACEGGVDVDLAAVFAEPDTPVRM